ncbi:MAG: hypothetical protein EP330_04385 [Deltaproteobacteria bacterium]|nr:MAG: hypothetical protein EP330_04385 [Deltaproteobacteria bacterium]
MARAWLMALTLLISSTAVGAETVRDLSGRQVSLEDAGTVVLFWSMSDADAPAELAQLAEAERLGWPVLAVNTDGPTRRGQVRPYLRRHGLGELPATVDADAALMQRVRGEQGGAFMVESGVAQARAEGPSMLLAPADDGRERAIARERRRDVQPTDDRPPRDIFDLTPPTEDEQPWPGVPAASERR